MMISSLRLGYCAHVNPFISASSRRRRYSRASCSSSLARAKLSLINDKSNKTIACDPESCHRNSYRSTCYSHTINTIKPSFASDYEMNQAKELFPYEAKIWKCKRIERVDDDDKEDEERTNDGEINWNIFLDRRKECTEFSLWKSRIQWKRWHFDDDSEVCEKYESRVLHCLLRPAKGSICTWCWLRTYCFVSRA